MTYLDDELAGLDPVELFEFVAGANTWRMTNGDADYVHPTTGDLYTADMIKREPLTQNDEDGSMSQKVVMDVFNPVVNFFRTPFIPLYQVWLTIYRTHVGSANVATLFRGRVGQCDFEGTTASLFCIPTRAAIQKKIPVQLVQILCNNTLYDGRCKANPELFKNTATITDIQGVLMSLAWIDRDTVARPAGWFGGGFIIKAGLPGATILRDELGPAKLRLLYNPGYAIGDVITAYAGCDKNKSTCINKFANLAHYQGFPDFPQQDPFQNEVL